MTFGLFVTAIILSLFANLANAQSRCDCREIIAACTGTVRAEGNWITITSTSQACSRIDYYINGEPRLDVVMDGRDQVEWLGPSKIESLDVQGCVVCKDTHFSSGSKPGSGEPGSLRVDPLDQKLLGLWVKTPRTLQLQLVTTYQTGTMTVTRKLGSGRYSVSSTTESRNVLKPGREFLPGHCWGRQSECITLETVNGTLRISGSQVTINFDNPKWTPDSLTLSGNVLQGSDGFGSMEFVKR